MSSLRDLQRQFVGALFDELPDARTELLIYRNNLHEGFCKALALEFPVIQRLVGADYFRQLGCDFIHAHPSRGGDLHAIGAPFPQYLRDRFAGTEYAYLPDVAELEWAYEQAAIAADAAMFDVRSLAHIAPDSYGELRFSLHPACYLVSSIYPILRIWQVNQADVDADLTVDLSTGPDHIVTRRAGLRVELVRISPGEFRLLQCFARNATLGEALTMLQRDDPAFDLGAALRGLIRLEILNKGILP